VLAVPDIDAARADLVPRGVESARSSTTPAAVVIGGFRAGTDERSPGLDPEGAPLPSTRR